MGPKSYSSIKTTSCMLHIFFVPFVSFHQPSKKHSRKTPLIPRPVDPSSPPPTLPLPLLPPRPPLLLCQLPLWSHAGAVVVLQGPAGGLDGGRGPPGGLAGRDSAPVAHPAGLPACSPGALLGACPWM